MRRKAPLYDRGSGNAVNVGEAFEGCTTVLGEWLLTQCADVQSALLNALLLDGRERSRCSIGHGESFIAGSERQLREAVVDSR